MPGSLNCTYVLIALLTLNCDGGPSSSGPTEPPAQPPVQPPAQPPAPLPTTLSGKIVFARAANRTNVLMAMNTDLTGLVSLGVYGYTPDVSPDGRKVVYSTPDEGIAVFDLATGRVSELATRLSVAPKWSPDGRTILFWSDRSGKREIWTMNADGTAAKQLTSGGGENLEGDWSPDGSKIVFRRVTPGSGGGDLWLINADGTDARLFYAGDRMDSDPRWSRTARKIAFVRLMPREPTGVTSEIFVIDEDGTNLVRLTNDAADDWAPRWAPDGSKIAFFGFHAGPDDPDLFTVSPDGLDRAVLLDGPTYDHGAVFGPAR